MMVVRTLLPSYALSYCVCLLCLIPFICEAALDSLPPDLLDEDVAALDSSHLPLDLLDSDVAALDSPHLPPDLLGSDVDDDNSNSSSTDESVLLDEHDGVAWTGAGTPMPELVAPLEPAVVIAAGTLEPAIVTSGTPGPVVAVAAGGTPEPGTATAKILDGVVVGGTGGRA